MHTLTRQRPALRPDPNARREAALSTWVRTAVAHGMAALDQSRPSEQARRRWGDDTAREVDLMTRAAVAPALLSTTPGLAHAVSAFLDALVPVSAGASLLAHGLSLDFAGAAEINVPNFVLPNAAFIAEGAATPVQQASNVPGAKLLPHKISSIAVLSNELLRGSNAEILVRQILLEAAGPALDRVMFSANPASASEPAGLLTGIAALPPAAAGDKSQALTDDLQALVLAVSTVAGNGQLALVGSADVIAAVRLRLPQAPDWIILTSSALAPRTIVLVALNALVSSTDGPPQVVASVQTAMHMADPAGELVDIGGVFARPVLSTYQTDTVAMKLKWPITWALRDPRGAAWVQGVNW